MHCSGPLPLTFEGPEQGFGGKNCQNASRGEKPCVAFEYLHKYERKSCQLSYPRMELAIEMQHSRASVWYSMNGYTFTEDNSYFLFFAYLLKEG